jgi:hypothetical protein
MRHRPSSRERPKTDLGVNLERPALTVEREWLAEIIAGTKKTEYRQITYR